MKIAVKHRAGTLWMAAGVAAAMQLAAQTPATLPVNGPAAAPPTGAPAAAARTRPAAYPSRPPADPAALARGKALYGVNCNFCHGSDARGGEGGPNLLRSELVLNDKSGELIAPVVQNGRPDQGMPRFPLSLAQITDIAAYIHDFKVGGYDISRMTPPSILVGDAKAGEKYFQVTCASCHSISGDLKDLGGRISDAKLLQDTFLMPGGGGGFRPRGGPALHVPPTTATITMPSGEKVEGALSRIDDFMIAVTLADGTERSFRRDGDIPTVEIHDPLQPHKDLLSRYTDQDIHNLTAYLVTLK